MRAQGTKLETAESELKKLMADVTRAMEKAEQAVARIADKDKAATADAQAEAATRAA